MRKSKALELLGGKVESEVEAIAAAAKAIDISYQAVQKWPDPLPPRIADRVQAAIARRLLPAKVLGLEKPKQRRRAKVQA